MNALPKIPALEDQNAHIKSELEFAGIQPRKIGVAEKGKVFVRMIGEIHSWTFKRTDDFFVCEGAGIPLTPAMELWREFGSVVKVDGLTTSPSPLEIFHGLGVNCYTVHSLDGLKALAETIKAIVKSGGK